jgi:hypothetical protein
LDDASLARRLNGAGGTNGHLAPRVVRPSPTASVIPAVPAATAASAAQAPQALVPPAAVHVAPAAPERVEAPRVVAQRPRDLSAVLAWIALGAILALALALRLREPLSSPVMGAEDPYRHMERTWDLAQGLGFGDYPVGFTALLLPLTALGPTGFYAAAKFLPPLWGVLFALGTYCLARRGLGRAASLAAALLVAVMPETIRRSDLLFPTALDLALLPWGLLLLLVALDGGPKASRAGVAAAALGVVLLAVHPWTVALLAPPLAVVAALLLAKRRRWRTAALVGAGVAVGGLLVAAARLGSLAALLGHAFAHLGRLAAHLGSLFPLPAFVDLPAMLGSVVLLLAAVGAGLAVWRRTPLGLLAVALAVFLLPLALVDWFDVWYIPHRTVAYLALPVALLAAIPVGEVASAARRAWPRSGAAPAAAILLLLGALVVPAGAAMEPWYRIYTPEDQDAWRALAARGTPYVMAGSWESRAGYRALTGRAAEFNPGFFQDAGVRDYLVKQHPGLVVLVDNRTVEQGLPTGFLASWQVVERWSTGSAYAKG